VILSPKDVTAVVVTTGKHDTREVIESLRPFGDLVIWDNSQFNDLKVYGRYHGASLGLSPFIYTQDDDTVIDWPALLDEWDDQWRILCNMPHRWHNAYKGTGICLVGFGTLFRREMIAEPFRRYDAAGFPRDGVFMRECDRVFTHENRQFIDWTEVPMRQMSYSSAPDRMYVQQTTPGEYTEIRRRLKLIPGRLMRAAEA